MKTISRQLFETIQAEGSLLPADILERVASFDAELPGISTSAYHLESGTKLNEATNAAWNRMRTSWQNFRLAFSRLPENDLATTVTREKWLLPLFQDLGFGRLIPTRATEIEGKSYPIYSIWAEKVPIHLVGCRVDMDKRTPGVSGAAQSSPHGLVQEFLNRSDSHLWGIVSNGLRLRLLRDNVSLTRQAYVEFDLESMMEGESYPDFVVMWLVIHQSRFEAAKPEDCFLEKWTQHAKERGVRALDQLRGGVESAITTLGKGFLSHPANKRLREQLRSGDLNAQDYYRQLLRIVYRLIFIFVAEDRGGLLLPGEELNEARARYLNYYSTRRLRQMSLRRLGSRHGDLYFGFRLIMQKLGSDEGCPELALPALGSFLFSPEAVKDLEWCEISNRDFLAAIQALSATQTGGVKRSIDYKNLGAEELGSVYESLLELHPELNIDAATFELRIAGGNERKTTGSYYTPSSLINCLIDSALDPVLNEAAKSKEPEKAILNLKVCDPACGSGHFLVAAAHRIARRLASIRTGDEEPSPEAIRTALRDVIGRCIYGVDLNPMSVELCKVSLWIEALESGKPLSFLDHHIRVGNSLLGATPELIAAGLPDEAFNAIEGDDKKACAALKKRNKNQRQESGPLFKQQDAELQVRLQQAAASLEELPDNRPEEIHAKELAFRCFEHAKEFIHKKHLADTWCATFVIRKDFLEPGRTSSAIGITQGHLNDLANGQLFPPELSIELERLTGQYQFFHWHQSFPEVFAKGGFDCVLGNPPWEKINLKDEEFFAESHPHIANAANKAVRKKLLEQLKVDEPSAYARYEAAKEMHDRTSSFFRHSGYYPLTGLSRINLYSVFCETALRLLIPKGRCGMVLASGIVTDDNNKALFSSLVNAQRLIHAWDFENREGIFSDVDSRYKFCLFCSGGVQTYCKQPDFAFYLTNIEHLGDQGRHFCLDADDLHLLNPNTRNCPTFRNKGEAEVTKSIYRRVPAWEFHEKSEVWPGRPKTPFNMSNDSPLFTEKKRLNEFGGKGSINLPLYEAKLVHQFNHRFATFAAGTDEGVKEFSTMELVVPSCFIDSRYWLSKQVLNERFPGKWFLVFRDITCATNERTSISAIIPESPCGNTLSIIEKIGAINAAVLCGTLNSFAYDYCARQKVSGTHMNHWIWKQLPIPSLDLLQSPCMWMKKSNDNNTEPIDTFQLWALNRVLELIYTAWDLQSFAQDCGWSGPPFRWNEERRFLLRCELDAAFFHLYLPAEANGDWRKAENETAEDLARLKSSFSTPRDSVAYIMDTFPIVKRKDEAACGFYRTKDTTLEIYDEMARVMADNAIVEAAGQQPIAYYQTRLDPPPGPPVDAAGQFIPLSEWHCLDPHVISHIHSPREVEKLVEIWPNVEAMIFVDYEQEAQDFPQNGRERFIYNILPYLVERKPDCTFQFYIDAAFLTTRTDLCHAILREQASRQRLAEIRTRLGLDKWFEGNQSFKASDLRQFLQDDRQVQIDVMSGLVTRPPSAINLKILPDGLPDLLDFALEAALILHSDQMAYERARDQAQINFHKEYERVAIA